MRRAVFSGGGRIEIGEGALPVAGDGEVRVRVGACCLCGSDLRPWRQGWPVTPGHEIAGLVDQPGHPRHGERVAVYIPVHCGDCEECRAGHTNVCRAMTDLVGWQRPGGYAEALNVPGQCLLPLPDDVPMDLAPLLLDTVGTAAHGVRLAMKVVPPGPALVLGAGPIGLGALIVLRRLGFGPVAVVEPQAMRLRIAEEMGGRPTAPEAIGERYPLVVEASGKDAARQLALDRVAPRGVVIQLGEADRWTIEETRPIRRKDFFLIRSFYFARDEWPECIDLFRADRASYERLVDARVDLPALPDLFEAFARGERIKPALVLPP